MNTMQPKSLKKEIEKLGGWANLTKDSRERTGVIGVLANHDIEMLTGANNFYTTRPIKDRGSYDAGSDYNSGGYVFHERIKDLGIYLLNKQS